MDVTASCQGRSHGQWHRAEAPPLGPAYTMWPRSSIIMRSKRRKQVGVGEWMVAQMVIPVFISPFTTLITCRGPPLIRRSIF